MTAAPFPMPPCSVPGRAGLDRRSCPWCWIPGTPCAWSGRFWMWWSFELGAVFSGGMPFGWGDFCGKVQCGRRHGWPPCLLPQVFLTGDCLVKYGKTAVWKQCRALVPRGMEGAAGCEKIPASARFSAGPETERRRVFLSWLVTTKSLFLKSVAEQQV